MATERKRLTRSLLGLMASVLLFAALAPPAEADSFAVQPDGKIVIAGEAPGGFGMFARLLPNGSLDPTFGEGGIAIDRDSPDFTRLAFQGDGGIIAMVYNALLRRYRADGASDSSFGRNGWLRLPNWGLPAFLFTLGGGRIAVGGNFQVKTLTWQAQASVVAPDGSATESVGFLQPYATLTALAPQADGTLVMAASTVFPPDDEINSPRHEVLARLVPGSGTPYDPAFGNGAGLVPTPPPPDSATIRLNALTSEPGGIVGGGEAAGHIVLSRYSSEGAIDRSFGANGFAEVSPGPGPSKANDLALTTDGKVLVAADTDLGRTCAGVKLADACPAPLVLRFLANGALDPSFGEGGVVRLPELAAQRVLGSSETLVSTAEGGALVGGGLPGKRWLAKLSADGRLDPSFGSGGILIVEACPGSEKLQRKGGCLPSMRASLHVRHAAKGHAAVRLDVRPNVEWGRVAKIELTLPRQLKPVRARARLIRARLDMPGKRSNRTTRLAVHGRHLSAVWTESSSAVSIRVPAKALEIVKPLPKGRAVPFRLKVQLGTAFAWAGGPQRAVFRQSPR
jgi:uncharacterized delta-60 repeat protein